ncbi:IS110 family transposase [Bifidobacterium saguinibicoloris]|uniref:IS110 family transposase n=1 Tax=Bifidobacterium saguinibicoloris TaxID=2834433 RepID=UPI001C57C4BC|nr:IS110 family transposase [Bifidobacterium saguinibicoloris]MBW3081077.1 IS110 family transposase [Bifidobacterium saguinibicoloris]
MMGPDDIDVWVGLDVGKSAHHACALDRDGNTLYDRPLKQDEQAIRTMLERLREHGRVLLVVDQPNTIGSLPLTVARSMGVTAAYLPGTAMRRTAQLLPGAAKTDQRDAHVIAWAALRLPESLRDAGPDDETLAALKLLAGHDEDLAHESTRHINRLRSLLLQTHPAFERVLKGDRIAHDATLALLEHYGGPTGMSKAGIDQVRAWAKDNKLRAGTIIDDMFKAIGQQTVTVPGTLTAETIIPAIAHDVKTIKDRRRDLAAQVEKLLEDHPLLRVLTSMPGVGVRTASNILLGIGGDVTRFKSAAHLAAYAGIAPVTSQSGTSIKGERPARGGNKQLKNALWQSAFVASTKHPPSIAYYNRKREQGKHHNAAVICLARRRCDVIYSMLKNGTLYQEPTLAA